MSCDGKSFSSNSTAAATTPLPRWPHRLLEFSVSFVGSRSIYREQASLVLILERLLELELTRVSDDNLLGGRGAVEILDLLDNVHALEHLAEDDVAAVEPRGGDGADEELGAIGVGASAVGVGVA